MFWDKPKVMESVRYFKKILTDSITFEKGERGGVDHWVRPLWKISISQGLRSWGQFRKNMFFHEKKVKTNIFMCFWTFPVLSDAERSKLFFSF